MAVVLFVNSCKKDLANDPSSITHNALLSEAKAFFEDEVLGNNLSIPNDQNYRHGIVKFPDWEHATLKAISIGNALIVPLKYNEKIFFKQDKDSDTELALEKASYLMCYKNSEGEMQVEWVTLMPQDFKLKSFTNFKGVAVVEDWYGNFIKAYAYDGQKNTMPLVPSETRLYKTSFSSGITCYSVPLWGFNYVPSMPELGVFYHQYGYETYCTGLADYGDNGDNPGWAVAQSRAKNGGGTGRGNQTPKNRQREQETNAEDYVPATRDIRNKTTDPCISKTVQAALDANKDIEGAMGDIIKKFDASKTVTVNIFDGITINGFPGQYQGGGFVGNKFQANITLQTDYFKNSSKEAVITVLIHEFVHAYIHTSGNQILQADHDAISEKYISPMASYLMQYFGIEIKDAYALAWSGVPDSKAWALAPLDFEFTMSNGAKITKQETVNLSGPYKDNDPNFLKGIKICD